MPGSRRGGSGARCWLRLAGISTLEAANAWLPGFVADYNRRFACPPASPKDRHRPLGAADDLDAILVCRERRTVTHSLSVQWKRTLLLLEPTPLASSLARQTVEVVEAPDGRLTVQSGGVSLAFRTITPAYWRRHALEPDAVVGSKGLDAALAALHEHQAAQACAIHATGA